MRGNAIKPILDGARGQPPADLTAVTDALVKFSQLAVDLGDRILEMDVNPLKKATFY